MTDLNLRGKCKEMSQALCEKDKDLRLAKGWYHCWSWGKQEHWWCVSSSGDIVDPTVNQFPAPHVGEYEEFNGTVECSECGKETDSFTMQGNYPVCSDACAMRLVGL